MDAEDELFIEDELDDSADAVDGLDDDSDLDGGVIPDDYDELGDDDDDDDDLDDLDGDDDDDDEDDYETPPSTTSTSWSRCTGRTGARRHRARSADGQRPRRLIDQLRRLPGDAGAVGWSPSPGSSSCCAGCAAATQVLLNDSIAANDWPIARDVVDYLGIEVPDPDGDSEPLGDFGMLVDQGVSEFDLEQIASDLDEDSDQLVHRLVDLMKFGVPFDRAVN